MLGAGEESRNREVALQEKIKAIRCDHDGLKMAEVQGGHLVLRTKHHGETHVKIVALAELAVGPGEWRVVPSS